MLEYGIPALIAVPDDASLTDVIFSRAASAPGQVVIRRRAADGTWSDVTAAEFCAEVSALAAALVAAGIEPGDRVALLSATRYEWTLTDYAIWTAGAVTVPVYETSSAEQVEWILSDSGAKAAIAETDEHEQLIAGVRDRLPALADVWRVDGLATLAATGAAVSTDQLHAARKARQAGDLATDHLHLGHHRAAQGMRADPPQPAVGGP